MAESVVSNEDLYAELPPNHIRLVEIEGVQHSEGQQRTGPEQPLICSLHVVSLDDILPCPVSYTALSYVWGSQDLHRTISCNGHLVKVTMNLYDALWNIRTRSLPISRLLWVDYLCINQSHEKEKNQQVALMGQIFKNAEIVLAWLGSAAGVPGEEVKKLLDSLKDPGSLSTNINLLVDTSWFRRIWTLQEIVLARKAVVAFGPICMDWDTLSETNVGRDAREPISRIETLRRSKHNGLRQLLCASSGRSCSNPRDRVYGLLGMWHDQKSIRPEYGKSLREVYAQAIFALCREQAGMPEFCLSHIQRIKQRDASPLWQRTISLATPTSWISTESQLAENQPQGIRWGNRPTSCARKSYFPASQPDFELVGMNLKVRSLLVGNLITAGPLTDEPKIFGVRMEDAMPFPLCFDKAILSVAQQDATSSGKLHGESRSLEAHDNTFSLYQASLSHRGGLCSCNENWGMDTPTHEPILWLASIYGYPYTLVVRPLVDFAMKEVKYELVAQLTDYEHLWRKSGGSGEYESEVFARWRESNACRGSEALQERESWLPVTMEICGDPEDIQNRLAGMDGKI